jgi:hypothetical protein
MRMALSPFGRLAGDENCGDLILVDQLEAEIKTQERGQSTINIHNH